jgi:hypothetical protein
MLSNHLINVRVEDREMSANIRLKWCKNVDLIHVPNSIKNRCNVLKINIGSNSAGITKEKQVLDNQVLVFLFYHELMALADVNA